MYICIYNVPVRSLGRSWVEANAFVRRSERVRTRRRTCSQAEANVFARRDEHGCTRTQTRVRYTLHLNGTVHVRITNSHNCLDLFIKLLSIDVSCILLRLGVKKHIHNVLWNRARQEKLIRVDMFFIHVYVHITCTWMGFEPIIFRLLSLHHLSI